MSTQKSIRTEAQIRDLPTPDKDLTIGLGDSLYLRVRAGTGSKSFVIRKRSQGKWTVTTLGPWPQWSLQRARAAALAPTSTPLAKLTFGESTATFAREIIEARYRSSPGETTAYFTRDCASLSAVRLSALSRGQLIGVVRAKAEATPNAGRKLLALLKQWSKWAVLQDHMAVDLLGVVTVSNIGLPQPQSRDRVLTEDELKAVMNGTGRDAGLLRFALSTCCRIGEALGMAPDQVKDRTWTIPLTKNGRSHSLWLTDLALAQTPFEASPYISVHGRLRASGVTWNLHDLRRTGASLMREQGVSIETVEAILNHSPGRLVQVYQRQNRMPEIRAGLEALEKRLLTFVAK
ncbi:hypothetical protein D621_05680 [beta proteobacterium AAP51]|nr:hypothetical protein D621_05680 [beta proteobacterium AAP51]